MSEPAAEDDTRVPVATERERQWARIRAAILAYEAERQRQAVSDEV